MELCNSLDRGTCGTETAWNHQDEKVQSKTQGLGTALEPCGLYKVDETCMERKKG